MIDRRSLLAVLPAAVCANAYAAEAGGALQTFEQTTGGRIGLFAENLKTGAKIAWRADERFAMCSTFKMSLAACVLARVDRGEETLASTVRFGEADLQEYAPAAKAALAKGKMSVAELCRAAVELSDNTCTNLLLARIGGPPAMTAFWRATGDEVTRLDHDEPVMSRARPPEPQDTTTPAAMAGNLRRLLLGDVLSLASRERLTGWMRDCQTGTDLLRAGLPAGWAVADKTGSNGRDVLGDIAVAWPTTGAPPVIICAYTRGGAPTQPQLRRLIADLGRLVGEQIA